MIKILSTLTLPLLLSACGQGLDGTYSDENGMMTYEFDSNGTAYVEAMGVGTELEYEIDGERLKVFDPGSGENLIMTINDDGSIRGPMGMRLTKVD